MQVLNIIIVNIYSSLEYKIVVAQQSKIIRITIKIVKIFSNFFLRCFSMKSNYEKIIFSK